MIDHTPYLLPGNLRTGEDVYAWMSTCSRRRWRWHCETGGPTNGFPEDDERTMLRHRLDVERRQACRRAALLHWRDMRVLVCTASNWTRFGDHGEAQKRWQLVYNSFSKAVAFRSAAKESVVL